MTTQHPFGELENKDLATSTDLETKKTPTGDGAGDDDEETSLSATPPPLPAAPDAESATEAPAETVEVEMIHHDDFNGENLLPGKTYPVSPAKAATLIAARRAKLA